MKITEFIIGGIIAAIIGLSIQTAIVLLHPPVVEHLTSTREVVEEDMFPMIFNSSEHALGCALATITLIMF